MSEKNEGMPFVPEEDLNLHENFQPIIAENGLIRPQKPPQIPEDLATSPDLTFTRMDTVQDLVQIRAAEERAKAEAAAAKEEQAKDASHEGEKPQPLPPVETPVQMQTVSAEPFVPNTSPAQPEPPAPEVAPAQPEELVPPNASVPAEPPTQPEPPAQPNPISAPKKQAFAKEEVPTELLPEIPFAAPVPKKRKSKKERRKLKAAAKEKQAATQTPAQQSAQQPVALLPAPAPKKRRYWPWVLAVLCFLFLGTIGGVIPVEKIPILRNIAYAMGFSKDDTSRMSFLRALLTWTDKTIGLPGQWADEQSRLAALERARMQGAAPNGEELGSLSARLQREGGQTRLIDINALNALQRQKGRQVDTILSASASNNPDNGPQPAALANQDANVHTEANRENGEVFFGSDASGVNRNSQDGYDSINAFKKIANPHIAGVNSADWLTNTARSMLRADTGLNGINKQFNALHLNWGSTINDIGDDKEHRDLYHAWITSRMAKYTSNEMVKKALADTGFMGAEMPTTASNVIGLGGIQLDTTSFREDQEAWAEYVKFEKQCKETLSTSGKDVEKYDEQFNALVKNAGNWDFPSSCVDPRVNTTYEQTQFSASVRDIQGICKKLNKAYDDLRTECKMAISYSANNCSDTIHTRYKTYWNTFQTRCNVAFEEEFEEWYKSHASEYTDENAAKNAFRNGAWQDIGKTYTQEKYVSAVLAGDNFKRNNADRDIVTMLDVVIDQNGGSSDYFPEVDTKGSIENYMDENKAF